MIQEGKAWRNRLPNFHSEEYKTLKKYSHLESIAYYALELQKNYDQLNHVYKKKIIIIHSPWASKVYIPLPLPLPLKYATNKNVPTIVFFPVSDLSLELKWLI